MKKDYYYQLGIETLNEIKKSGKKPTLLLHSCCAPCNCYPMLVLSEYFEMTLYFNNNNIYPREEYLIRLNELINYTNDFNKQHQTNIDIIVTEYDNETYNKHLEPYKDEPELANRCWLCYRLRMEEAYQYASLHNFDYFTTVMTISRQKNSIKLNEIGMELALRYPNVKYFVSDLKKHGGSDMSSQLTKELDLYRQQYCGCIYSYQGYQMKLARKQGK